MRYTVLFDVSNQPYPGPVWPIVYAGLLAGALLVVALAITMRGSAATKRVRIYLVGIAVGLGIISLAMLGIKSRHDGLVNATVSGRTQVAEGVVEEFHPMPFTGHDSERFTVGGQKFSYSDFEQTGGFNNTSSHGGPMKDGLPVRITYIKRGSANIIVRLEEASGRE